jgi:hypothetical protein
MRQTHERWLANANRHTDDSNYQEAWYFEQCGGCRFWLPLAGPAGEDFGVCSNALSPFDGTARFEHDGCDEFEDGGGWATPD